MSSIYAFPVRGFGQPDRVVLACFATIITHEDDFLDEIRKYCDRNSPPDEVILLAPEFSAAKLDSIRESGRFLTRLPSASRYRDTPSVERICFGADGLRKVAGDHVTTLVHAGMSNIFHRHNGFIYGSSAFHYVKPSGRHCDGFLRTANVLVRGVEIEFIASCCLDACPKQMTRIYTDTGAIHSVAFAVLRLLSKFNDPRSESHVDSFGSYTSLNEFPFLDAEQSLVLISASTSGNLLRTLRDKEPRIRSEHIATIYHLGDKQEAAGSVCDLTFHPTENPDGLAPVKSYAADSCPLCVSSRAVRMSEEQFIPQGPHVDPVLIKAKDAPESTSAFIAPLVGHCVFKANYREHGSSSASREIFLDLHHVFSTDTFFAIQDLQSKFERFASHLVSANTKQIIHLNDSASKHFAGRIATFANRNNVQDINIFSASQLQDLVRKNPRFEGTTIVAASAISTGRGLSEVSKSLRFAQVGGAIKYAVAYCRTKNQALTQDIQKHLSYGVHGPREHSVSLIYEYNLPSWRPEGKTSWEAEFAILSDPFDELPAELEQRRELLRQSSSSAIRGLTDNLFLSTQNGHELVLRPRFAFWKFDYTAETFGEGRSPSQADVYATIVAVLHNLREAKRGTDHSLRQADHVRKVLSPRCFERYNDGVIQASLLRAAHTAELDYSTRDDLSEDMSNIVSTIFDQPESSVGEASNEFLLALALGKLRLCASHVAALKSEYLPGVTDPFASFFWKKIVKLYDIG